MILLDTHVLVRYMQDERKLGRRARATIDRAVAKDELFVSAISFWEVATLVAKRRLELDTTVAAFRDLAIRNGAREQVLDGSSAERRSAWAALNTRMGEGRCLPELAERPSPTAVGCSASVLESRTT